MKNLILLILLFTVNAYAQTAKVIQLSDEDAAQAKSLYQQKKDIEQKISDLQIKILENYMSVPHPKSKDKYFLLKEGWDTGFEYSEDFKFVVPSDQDSRITVDARVVKDCLSILQQVQPSGGTTFQGGNNLTYEPNSSSR